MSSRATHEMHFRPLQPGVSELAVPCDREGRVDLDALTDEVRRAYLFARATMGRCYTRPAVVPAAA